MSEPIWDNLWINATIALMSGEVDYPLLHKAAIASKEGNIVYVGLEKDIPSAPQYLAKEVYNAAGRFITPGLIDSHTHLVYAGNRADEFQLRQQGLTYADIAQHGGGILSTVKQTRVADAKALYQQSAKRLQSFLNEGVTTLEIKSGYGLDLPNELKMLQVARQLSKNFPVTIQTTFLGAHTLPPEYADDADAYLTFMLETVLPLAYEQGLVDAVDGFCDKMAFTPAQIKRVFEKARALNLPVKLHAEQLSTQGGAALAAQYGALSADHLEFVTHEQIKQMALNKVIAVLLPGAYYCLQEKQSPPIAWFRQESVRMAVASDSNPGSSPISSILLVMNMAAILFKLTPLEVLQGVTKHAAMALGLSPLCGTLEVGKWADFVIWDVQHPAELIFQLGSNPCCQVVKKGKIVINRE